MASKSRIYSVIIRDGFGEKEVFYPAQSKEDLSNKVAEEISSSERIVEIEYLGWIEILVDVDHEMDGVCFKLYINGKEVTVSKGDLGYGHLEQLFPAKVKDVENHLNRRHNPNC